MKRTLIWTVSMVAAALGGAIGIGWMQDRRFPEEHKPPGKLLRVGSHFVHALEAHGAGATVVFIHGNPGTAEDFADVQKRLSPEIRTIALDRPGYGWTDRPQQQMAPQAQARMLHDALKELGVVKPVLVGFSFGGPVITAWVREFPDEVAALVYICAVADPIEGHQMRGAQAMLVEPLLGKALAYGVGPYLGGDAVERGYVDAFFPQPADRGVVDRGKLQFTRPRTLLSSAWDWRSLEAELPELAAHYPKIEVPVEALSSNQDRIVGPAHIKTLGDHIRGIHVVHLEQAGHQVMSTHPNDVVQAIQRAIDRVK